MTLQFLQILKLQNMLSYRDTVLRVELNISLDGCSFKPCSEVGLYYIR